MTIYNFNDLPDSNKIGLLQTDGVYVGKRNGNGSTIILFQLYHFYVEIEYKEYRKRIASFEVTEDTNILNAYLHQIDINELNFCL